MDMLILDTLPVPNFYELPGPIADEIRYVMSRWNKRQAEKLRAS